MRSGHSVRVVRAFFIMKRYVLIGGDGEPCESWINVLTEGDTYEDVEAVMLDMVRNELIQWYKIIDVVHYEVI